MFRQFSRPVLRGFAGLDHLSASPILGGFMGEAGMGVYARINKNSEWRRHTSLTSSLIEYIYSSTFGGSS